MKWLNFLIILVVINFVSCDSSTKKEEQTPPSTKTGTPFIKTTDANVPGEKESHYSKDRVIWQKPELVLSLLEPLEGKVAADIGAGMGFFTFPLLPLAEKVIAIDIDPYFLHHIDSVKIANLVPEDRKRLETRVVKGDKIPLETEEIDVAVIVNTFMFIPNHDKYLKELLKKLKPGGTLLIVDFKKRQIPLGPKQTYKIPLYKVENELYKAGFSTVTAYDILLEYQYILVAKKAG